MDTDPVTDIYRMMLDHLNTLSKPHPSITYLENTHFSISVTYCHDEDAWVEIKEFLVKVPYRQQGYGTKLVRKLSVSPIRIKITSVLSAHLRKMLVRERWTREAHTYNYIKRASP